MFSELPLIWTPEMRPPLYWSHFEMSQSMLPSANPPLKWGHPFNQDILTGPKGGGLEGVHCTYYMTVYDIMFVGTPPPDCTLRAMAIHTAPEKIGDHLICCPKHLDINQKNGTLECDGLCSYMKVSTYAPHTTRTLEWTLYTVNLNPEIRLPLCWDHFKNVPKYAS